MTIISRQPRGPVPDQARRSDQAQGYTRINVGPTERILSGVAGTAMLALGLQRRTYAGLALAVAGSAFAIRSLTGYSALYDALELDSAHDGHSVSRGVHDGVRVRKSFTVNRPPEECFQFWRRLENLPRFMTHLKSVQEFDARRSHWEAKSPTGGTVGWDAEILNERPNELIAWKSVGDSDVENAGSVRFRPAPGDRGTEITVELSYEPPAGRLGSAIAWLLGENPEFQVREDLRHFKQVLEAGEIPTTEGQPSCRR